MIIGKELKLAGFFWIITLVILLTIKLFFSENNLEIFGPSAGFIIHPEDNSKYLSSPFSYIGITIIIRYGLIAFNALLLFGMILYCNIKGYSSRFFLQMVVFLFLIFILILTAYNLSVIFIF